MHCPDCGSVLITLSLGMEPPVTLDVCSWCGGVWTDQGETNFFQAPDLSQVSLPRFPRRVPQPKERYCPKDHSRLARIKGESIPEDVAVFHCSSCGGNWFPAGELKRFKRAQRIKLSFFKTWHIPVASPAAILLPVVLLLIITGSIFVTVTSIQNQLQTESQAKALMGKPVVRNISPTEVFISFTTQRSISTSLTYWTTEVNKKTAVVNLQPQIIHTIRLSGLSPDTNYFYQITAESMSSEVFGFKTLK